MHLGLAASPGPAVPPGCGAGSGATTVGPHVLIGPTYSHRSDHSSACDASIRPLTAGWRPALRARNRGWLPGPKPSLSPPLPPPAPHSTPGRRWQNPPTSSATAPPPAFLPPNPKCSSGSTGRPDPRPPSDVEIGSKLPLLILFSGPRCCHLLRIQLFLQLGHQFCQHLLRIPPHRAPRLCPFRCRFTLLSRIVMLLHGRSP